MLRRVVVGGGAAAVLSVGVLIGGLTTGLVGAHPLHQATAAQSQAAPTPQAGNSGGEQNDGVSLPPGGISSTQAQQTATAYVQQTAPYSTQGLQFQEISLDDENGTVLYTASFSNASGQDVEVKLSTSGQVLGVESATEAPDGAGEAAGQGQQGDSQQSPETPGAGQD